MEGSATEQRTGGTRVVWVVMIVLAILLGAGAAILGKKTKKGYQAARAVVVPTDRARTVVVPPCATGAEITAQNASRQSSQIGSTTVQLPPGTGTRTLLVPKCGATKGAHQVGTSNLPSAVFVLPLGSAGASNMKSQVIVPNGSPATTVVVPQCEGKNGTGRSEVVAPQGGTALASFC
jgi:hypothetical protein